MNGHPVAALLHAGRLLHHLVHSRDEGALVEAWCAIQVEAAGVRVQLAPRLRHVAHHCAGMPQLQAGERGGREKGVNQGGRSTNMCSEAYTDLPRTCRVQLSQAAPAGRTQRHCSPAGAHLQLSFFSFLPSRSRLTVQQSGTVSVPLPSSSARARGVATTAPQVVADCSGDVRHLRLGGGSPITVIEAHYIGVLRRQERSQHPVADTFAIDGAGRAV